MRRRLLGRAVSGGLNGQSRAPRRRGQVVEGQRGGERRLAGLDMEERVVVRKQAVGGGAEGGVGGSQRRVGGVTPGGVGAGVLVGGQSSGGGEGGSRRQGTG